MKLSDAIEKFYTTYPQHRIATAVWWFKWDYEGNQLCVCPTLAAYLYLEDKIIHSDDLPQAMRDLDQRVWTSEHNTHYQFVPAELERMGVEVSEDATLYHLVRWIVLAVQKYKTWQDIVQILREEGN